MFKNVSLKTRIFFLVTVVVVASFLTVIWVVSNTTLQLAEKDAFNLAQETAEKYKNEIKAELQGSRVTAETLATVFESLKKHNLTDREVMNDILRSALAKKDYITAFCVAYDPNALDGLDKQYAGKKPAYDETGRYSPYWNKLGGNIDVEPLYDIDIADWYIVPKNTGHEYITNPYPYQVQGQSVMLASLVFPIVYQGRVIGIVASDIVLDKLQEMVSRVNPRGHGGYTEIISNSGAIVAHPDKRYLGKDLTESLLYHALASNPKSIDKAIRSLEQDAAKEDGEGPGQAAKLIGNLKAYAEHPDENKLDISLFTPELAKKMLASDLDVRRYVDEAKDAVQNGRTYTVRNEYFYSVYTPIQFSDVTMPWSVVVSIPMAEVMSNANNIRNYVTGVSLAAVCIIGFILYFIARSVTWPILVLGKAAKAIGEGDFQTIIPEVGGGNEINSLAGALRFMVGKNGELITELKVYSGKLEEKNDNLNRLDKLKDEFLANTSHELRTPIHGIIGIAESMVDGATGPLTNEQKYNLSIVSSSGKRLSNMINDILDFTKLKNQKMTLHIKPVDLNTIVETVLIISKPLIKRKDIKTLNEVSTEFPLIEADENRMQQILYNLIGNAIKFTEQGIIRISAEFRDGMAAISIADTGIGIPADKIDKIFESFEQVDGSIEREYGGTGLGLPITKKLVELHGGALTVESTIDAGSVFTFTIPSSRAAKRHTLSISKAELAVDVETIHNDNDIECSDQPNTEGSIQYRILAVDDEPINIQVLKNLLRMRNYSISVANSGIDALKMVESGEQFDLILLDVMMPKMSGYEVCRRLRIQHSLFQLPILMLTAKNQLQDIVLGFQSGANDYLSKPFDKDELLARVQTLLSLKDAVTTAIHNEKLFENERQKRILEQTLLDVTKAITSTLDLREVLAKVLDAMSSFIQFNKSIVLLKDEEKEDFKVELIRGKDAGNDMQEDATIDVAGDMFLSEIVSTGQPILDNKLESQFQGWCHEGEKLTGVPMFYRNNLLGIIVLCCRSGDISRDLLYTLAGQAGVAIQNARLFAKINLMATIDGLTGLFNRRYFFDLVEKEFVKYKRFGNSLAICMMDIDHFKKINDTFGHAAGDEVLRHLAGKLREQLRTYDIIGRYGGEEFSVAFPETTPEDAVKVAERIRMAVENSMVKTKDSGEIHYTISMGISSFNKEQGEKSLDEVFEEADQGLYKAKDTGRNKIVIFPGD